MAFLPRENGLKKFYSDNPYYPASLCRCYLTYSILFHCADSIMELYYTIVQIGMGSNCADYHGITLCRLPCADCIVIKASEPSYRGHCIVTIVSWPSYHDHRIVAIVSWPSYRVDCSVTIAAWLSQRDYRSVTIAAWLSQHDYYSVTVAAWLLQGDYRSVTIAA